MNKRKINKKKRTILNEYKFEVYPRYLAVMKGVDLDLLNKQYEELDGRSIVLSEDDLSSCAITLCVRHKNDKHIGYLVVIIDPKTEDKINTCAHEATHAWIFLKRGLGVDGADRYGETDAYPIGWITSKIYDTWNTK